LEGPPGTGKTTTIVAAAEIWAQDGIPTWIVAQSNVAVKNIAEKLYKRDVRFTILVSKEFHFEWYE
jgi:Rad3-related DNA helicase